MLSWCESMPPLPQSITIGTLRRDTWQTRRSSPSRIHSSVPSNNRSGQRAANPPSTAAEPRSCISTLPGRMNGIVLIYENASASAKISVFPMSMSASPPPEAGIVDHRRIREGFEPAHRRLKRSICSSGRCFGWRILHYCRRRQCCMAARNGTVHRHRDWMHMKTEDAEMVAIKMIEWLAKDERLFSNLARTTGVTVEDFKEHASNPEFLASVIDYLLSSEQMVVAFCEELSLPLAAPMEARQALPGGDLPNWT